MITGKKLSRLSLVVLAMMSLASCGYHVGHGGKIPSEGKTVCVPYIRGDLTGHATTALVHQLSTQGTLRYTKEGGDLLLKVELVDERTEHVGFRYQRDKTGALEDEVVAAEDRLSVLAKVWLLDNSTDQILLGPELISASVDYDYQTDPIRSNLTQFSAGQFDVFETAEDVALHALYDRLAQKIARYISDT